MERWHRAQRAPQPPQEAAAPAPPAINLLDYIDPEPLAAAPPPAAAPPAARPAPLGAPPLRPPAQPGVACHRDGDTLLLLHGGETHVAFPDRCVVCNRPVKRAYFEHEQKSVLRETFYLHKTTFWIPGLRVYEERSIDVDYTMCDSHRLRRRLGILWKLSAVLAFVAPFVTFNLGLHSVTVLWVLWAAGWIGGILLFVQGSRVGSPMVIVEIGPTIARFRVGRPFLESFPERTGPR